jgi:hypothetical protein
MFRDKSSLDEFKNFPMLTSGLKQKIIKTFLVLATQSTRSIEITTGEGREIDKKKSSGNAARVDNKKPKRTSRNGGSGKRWRKVRVSCGHFLHHHQSALSQILLLVLFVDWLHELKWL